MTENSLISVRAAINLRGLKVGRVVLVDPTIPYIAACIEKGYLVSVIASSESGNGSASSEP